nr:von Willebrand factor A domain containing protein [Hymenolepis microstoma]
MSDRKELSRRRLSEKEEDRQVRRAIEKGIAVQLEVVLLLNDSVIPQPPAQSKDEVVLVAELQEFGGYWNMNEETAKILKVDLAQLTSSKLPEAAKNEKVWATVPMIAYLRTCLASKKGEWKLVVKKAIDWLQNDQGSIQKAEGELKKLIKN